MPFNVCCSFLLPLYIFFLNENEQANEKLLAASPEGMKERRAVIPHMQPIVLKACWAELVISGEEETRCLKQL